jgi:hypothetical protein
MATSSRSRVSPVPNDSGIASSRWYGSRLTDQYGAEPKGDWCELIDDHENEVIAAALARSRPSTRSTRPASPKPMRSSRRLKAPSQAQDRPSMLEQLSEFVHRNRTLTANQLRMPWKYLGRMFDAPGIDGKTRTNHGVQITGVVVPADGENPGYRVMVTDMAEMHQPARISQAGSSR